MKLGEDLENLLLDFKITEKDNIPFIENFLTYSKGFTETREFLGYLCFLKMALNFYHKDKRLCSFIEFVNDRWPPEEKRPRAKRRRIKSIS